MSSAIEELMEKFEHLEVSELVEIGHLRDLGGFSEVYDGWMRVKGSKVKKKVAVKKFRVIRNQEENTVKVLSVTFNRSCRQC
jgi:hypothetical protein